MSDEKLFRIVIIEKDVNADKTEFIASIKDIKNSNYSFKDVDFEKVTYLHVNYRDGSKIFVHRNDGDPVMEHYIRYDNIKEVMKNHGFEKVKYKNQFIKTVEMTGYEFFRVYPDQGKLYGFKNCREYLLV